MLLEYARAAMEFFQGDATPAVTCFFYYLLVFFCAELSRAIVSSVSRPGRGIYDFCMELIGTAQMCTCVYENGIIIKHYGTLGFFIAAGMLLAVGIRLNRGAFISPCMPIEKFLNQEISPEKLLSIILAQTIGAYSAFHLATGIWYYSRNVSAHHNLFYSNLPCGFNYKVSFYYVLLFEMCGCFLIRLLSKRLSAFYPVFTIPVLVAGLLSFALAVIGVPGLNPVVTSSRLFGCPGLNTQWFMITYWCCPVIGWLAGAKFDRRRGPAYTTSRKSTTGRTVVDNNSNNKQKKFYAANKKKNN